MRMTRGRVANGSEVSLITASQGLVTGGGFEPSWRAELKRGQNSDEHGRGRDNWHT